MLFHPISQIGVQSGLVVHTPISFIWKTCCMWIDIGFSSKYRVVIRCASWVCVCVFAYLRQDFTHTNPRVVIYHRKMQEERTRTDAMPRGYYLTHYGQYDAIKWSLSSAQILQLMQNRNRARYLLHQKQIEKKLSARNRSTHTSQENVVNLSIPP